VKIKAHADAGDRKPLKEDSGDEIMRAQGSKVAVKRQHNGTVETRSGKQAQFRMLVGEPEQWLVRSKEAARVRFECQRRCRPVELPGALDRCGNDRAVPAMNTIKIANREDGTSQCTIVRAFAAKNSKMFGGLRLMSHDG
jgi:hypothetical protein